ncbi:MAG: protein kinase [Gemmatimonadaceae bacterium]|nr:protein kinase [Gemmatimonadaceae bacterium]
MLHDLQSALGASYRVERELGGGGMSRVFLATERALGRRVVIKVLAPEVATTLTATRFQREAEVTARLQHPHLLPVLSAGVAGEFLYYVTPYVEGETLRHRLDREGALPVADARRILREPSSALAYAHGQGIVHRDIKPENILLSNGLAVLADFGISSLAPDQAAGNATRLTQVGMSIGTPGYMSPEQAAGERDLDGRSDLYSLGVVGYEMLAGRPPFSGSSSADLIRQHMVAPPPSLADARDDVPPELAAIIAQLLAKEPNERFASAGALQDALWQSGTVSGKKKVGNDAVGEDPSRSMIGGRRARIVAAVVAVLLLAVAAVRWLPRSAPPDRRHAPDAADILVIAPFDVIGAHDEYREGLVDLLATALDGAGALRTVAPSTTLRAWPARARGDRETALALARQVHATLALHGSVVAAGKDSVRLRATILDAERNVPVGTDIDLMGETSRIDRLADTLSLAVLAQLRGTTNAGDARRGTMGSSSLPAIKAYLRGEQFYRRAQWDTAAAMYRVAIGADSTFALAFRRLGNSLGWKLQPDARVNEEGYHFLVRAGAMNHRLAPRDSVLVATDSLFGAAMLAQSDYTVLAPYAQVVRMTRVLEDATSRFGDDPEVWFKLGDARFHFTERIAPSLSGARGARDAFQQALSLDSTFVPAALHLTTVAASDQDEPAMRRAIALFIGAAPDGDVSTALRLVRDLLDRTPDAVARIEAVGRSRDFALQSNLAQVASPLLDSTEGAVHLFRAGLQSAQRGGLPEPIMDGLRWRFGNLLLLRGHMAEARTFLTRSQAPLLAQVALAGAMPIDSADQMMRGWGMDPADLAVSVGQAMWWSAREDTVQLQRLVSEVAARRERAHPTLRVLLPGLVALARRDTAAALSALDRPDSVCQVGCGALHLLRARILSAKRQDNAAAAILARPYSANDATRVLWMLERARVQERLGNRPAAIDSYLYVERAWSGGDQVLQPTVREAREALRRLSTDAPRARRTS